MNAVLSNGEPPVCEAVKNASKDVLSVLIKGKYRGVIIQYYRESITPSAYYVPIVGGARALAYDLGSLSIPNLFQMNVVTVLSLNKKSALGPTVTPFTYYSETSLNRPAAELNQMAG